MKKWRKTKKVKMSHLPKSLDLDHPIITTDTCCSIQLNWADVTIIQFAHLNCLFILAGAKEKKSFFFRCVLNVYTEKSRVDIRLKLNKTQTCILVNRNIKNFILFSFCSHSVFCFVKLFIMNLVPWANKQPYGRQFTCDIQYYCI